MELGKNENQITILKDLQRGDHEVCCMSENHQPGEKRPSLSTSDSKITSSNLTLGNTNTGHVKKNENNGFREISGLSFDNYEELKLSFDNLKFGDIDGKFIEGLRAHIIELRQKPLIEASCMNGPLTQRVDIAYLCHSIGYRSSTREFSCTRVLYRNEKLEQLANQLKLNFKYVLRRFISRMKESRGVTEIEKVNTCPHASKEAWCF
jgi:hypothetical protein